LPADPASAVRRIAQFGVFEVDFDVGELRREGRLVPMQQHPLAVLSALLEEPGREVTREELRRRLWPGQEFLDFENGINTAVGRLRQALRDSADNPRFIVTRRGHGYRFIAPVSWVSSPASRPNHIGTPAVPEAISTSRKSEESRRFSAPALPIIASVVLAVVMLAVLLRLVARNSSSAAASIPITPTLIHAPVGETLTGSLALSPSGRRLAFVSGGTTPEQSRLWLRSMNEVAARPLVGTEGGSMPFWSPDERAIGFFAQRKLKVIQLDSALITTIADVGRARGATWSRQGTILFAPDIDSPIFSVAASGGHAVPVTDLGAGPDHRFPFFLPDGEHFLYLVLAEDRDKSEVRWARLGGPETGTLLTAGSAAVYVSDGHILFARGGSLLAQPFDATRLSLTGAAVVVGERVGVYGEDGPTGLGMFSGGRDAVAVVDPPNPAQQLSWLDRQGKRIAEMGPPADYRRFDLSPDGARAAVVRVDPRKRASDLVIIDLATGSQTQLTDDPQPDSDPVWSPGGDRLAFGSLRAGRWRAFVRNATGAGEDTPLSDDCISVTAWFPDGRGVLCTTLGARTSLVKVAVDTDSPAVAVVSGLGYAEARISRDGSWLAYSSDHEGTREVYVIRLDRGTSKPIALGRGVSPRWQSDGKALFLLSGRTLVSVSFDPAKGTFGVRENLFNAPVAPTDSIQDFTPSFAAAPDGSRFLVLTPVVGDSPTAIRILSPLSSIFQK
jgi:eukaryotic-like serine/threonine-protein kinase